jgi:alkylation response protein AidB-like acyl-CoA dehydrogenase
MDFELTEFQTDLAEGVRRLCEGRFPLQALRTAEGSQQVVDKKGWRELGEAGVFNLCLTESAGGVGLGLPEAVLVFEELGRALVPGPLVASHLAAGLIEGAADGTAVVGLVERPAPGTTIPLVVEHLADLDTLLVLSDQGVAAVDPATLDATPVHRPMDPLTPLWIVATLPDGAEVGGSDLSARWRRDGAVLTAALQVGLAGWSTDLATAYAKTRTQFGRVIGGFQAVKHICADMVVRAEVARVAVQAAAVTIAQPDVGDAAVASFGAKLLADEAALANGKSCIQVHGGMGFTWEVPAHLAFKRARVLATQFGTDDELAGWLGDSLAL